jgi:hypothetical protein
MELHRIYWREVKPRLHYLYAMTKPGQSRRQELGWVWSDGEDDVYHSFNNYGDLGDYPSLEAAKRACETWHYLPDDGFGVVHIPSNHAHAPCRLNTEGEPKGRCQ